MAHFHSVTRKLVTLCAIVLLGGAAGCSKTGDEQRAPGPAQVVAGQGVVSKLGDLSAFQGISAEVAALVDKNDLSAAKSRIKDLELSWDSAEAGLKPRAAADWHVLDKGIDRALDALRAGNPQQADCKLAMDELLKTFNSLQGKQ
ncbi:hypothetical protein [Pseudomonas sp. Au-Pse12]|uniref:hypothetical protein n=1 Tax=Pseudomonas sp. Au-Pse12 TaxID=2906459 RepID=UPI001E3A3323|nr:hypothetical protein [Pseudomonas sp. Au-Pse12]MCE4054367.1 hypothetical protein [Pseudomonas sp. Au-Pse12]